MGPVVTPPLSSQCSLDLHNVHRRLGTRIRLLPNPICPSQRVPSPLLHVNEEPNDQRSTKAQRKEEREAHPVVAGLIDDGLDDIRAYHGGGTI